MPEERPPGTASRSGNAAMKILVCLLGYHQMPDQLAVHALIPDRIVLVAPPALMKKGSPAMLLRSLSLGGLDYSERHEVVPIDEEDSVSAVEDALLQVYSRYPDADWIVNITGGTKPMSIAAFEFFMVRNARVIYIPFSDPRQAMDFSGAPVIDLDYRISIAEFLAGYGFEILNREALKKASDRAQGLVRLAAVIASRCESPRAGCLDRFISLSRAVEGRDEGMEFGWEDGLFIEDDEIRAGVAVAFDIESDGVYLAGRLDKHAVQFLTGGWLEVFIWGLLRDIQGGAGSGNDRDGSLKGDSRGSNKGGRHDGEIWDLQIGVWFGRKGKPASLQNEWDIAFMRDQTLCVVECKTGEQENDPSGNDTLYRIEAVKGQLRAVRVRSYLVTTAPNVIDQKTGRVKDRLLLRASLYDSKIITGETVRELAGLYLSKNPSLADRTRDIFDMGRESKKV